MRSRDKSSNIFINQIMPQSVVVVVVAFNLISSFSTFWITEPGKMKQQAAMNF